jgi:transposase-like protein
MRLIARPPEERAEARRLSETTAMSCAEIAARVGRPPSTVRSWKCSDGWKRPPGAPARRTFTAEQRDAVRRLHEDGASFAGIARAIGRDRDTVSRAARRRRAAGAAPAATPFAELAPPEEVAKLHAALSAGRHGKRELLGLAGCAFALAALDLMGDRTLPTDRRAEALARTLATIKALPDDAPAAGDSLHDRQSGPAACDETNALLEELARRLEAFGARGEGDGVPRDAAAGNAGALP